MVAVAALLLLAGAFGVHEFSTPTPLSHILKAQQPKDANSRPSRLRLPASSSTSTPVAAMAPRQPAASVRRVAVTREPARALSEEEPRPARPDPAAAIAPGSGRSFRDTLADGRPCPDCPPMVVVPAGSFTMGSWIGEQGHDDDESPSHRVTIGRPFAVGQFDVTRGEYAAFVKATSYAGGNGCYTWNLADWTPRLTLSWRDPGFVQDDRHPVVCVSWGDAQAYVAWLRRRTAQPYRLLSEAEWEYAARAGSQARYFFGDDETKFCRYGDGADRSLISIAPPQPALACSDGHAFTAPVGSYRPERLRSLRHARQRPAMGRRLRTPQLPGRTAGRLRLDR